MDLCTVKSHHVPNLTNGTAAAECSTPTPSTSRRRRITPLERVVANGDDDLGFAERSFSTLRGTSHSDTTSNADDNSGTNDPRNDSLHPQ
ncbi:hypothetical protein I203_107540 [Kwoniella mangroviensis CBS 8507]|uniref:hypothetical protein n=1 Tax=Kwoniella mangroviensis CBS 8507 TaxID=1296122 RepID=UPI00305D6FEA